MDGPDLETVDDVIAVLGGCKAVAPVYGVSYRAAHNWKTRGFPRHTYAEMTEALARLGRTAPRRLWKMTEATPS